jgi:carboxymethylenebutenolidase
VISKIVTRKGQAATLGWCFGGGWSLNAALANDLDTAVIYYDWVTAGTDELAKLQPPLLGHFGTLDKSINPEMVGAFQQLLRAVGKQIAENSSVYRRSRFCQPNGRAL